MILPILAYGHPVLSNVSADIASDYPNLDQLINDMFETMYEASGVGLAAPQVGQNIRLFIVDASPFSEDDDPDLKELASFRKVFVNPHIVSETGEPWAFEEGCLSVPGIREEVWRPESVKLQYCDPDFTEKTEIFDGMKARIIQHEYDHLDGILFPDKVRPLRKKMLRRRLSRITAGDVEVKYRMKFPLKTKR